MKLTHLGNPSRGNCIAVNLLRRRLCSGYSNEQTGSLPYDTHLYSKGELEEMQKAANGRFSAVINKINNCFHYCCHIRKAVNGFLHAGVSIQARTALHNRVVEIGNLTRPQTGTNEVMVGHTGSNQILT